MTKKRSTEDVAVQAMLAEMRKQGLPVGADLTIRGVPTGISSFDIITGAGGFPRRRMSILQGEEGVGKSLLLLQTIASVQKKGGRAAFVDAEHALTPSFCDLLGVSFEDLIISRPRTLNQAYDVARGFWRSGLFDIVGFDSAPALSTDEEIDASASDTTKRAALAQIHSQELRKMVSTIHDRTALVMINQLRENPNPSMYARQRGIKELYAPGGKALKYYASLMVDVRRGESIKKGTVRIGQKQKVFVIKNKLAPPYQGADFDLHYASGVDMDADAISTGIRVGLIDRHSSYLSFTFIDLAGGISGDTIRENGRANFEAAMKARPDMLANLEAQLLAIDDNTGWGEYDPRSVDDGDE